VLKLPTVSAHRHPSASAHHELRFKLTATGGDVPQRARDIPEGFPACKKINCSFTCATASDNPLASHSCEKARRLTLKKCGCADQRAAPPARGRSISANALGYRAVQRVRPPHSPNWRDSCSRMVHRQGLENSRRNWRGRQLPIDPVMLYRAYCRLTRWQGDSQDEVRKLSYVVCVSALRSEMRSSGRHLFECAPEPK
jgi:hypothetical protein